MHVKICGIRREEDALACAELGVDLVGFNFWPQSKRFLAPGEAAPLARHLPSHVAKVGVFVQPTPAEVEAAVRAVGLDFVQLHGDEDPARFAHVGAAVIQVLRVREVGDLTTTRVSSVASHVLLDSWVDGFGGAGVAFPWSLARDAQSRLGRPVLVAGGLTPDNVGEAISAARPWGVDVASGVETAPGVKDRVRLAAFVAAVRALEASP